MKLGATGKFPQGQLNSRDEGELCMAVGIKDGVVMIDFGKPVKWLGLPPTEARGLAGLLLKHAENLEN